MGCAALCCCILNLLLHSISCCIPAPAWVLCVWSGLFAEHVTLNRLCLNVYKAQHSLILISLSQLGAVLRN